jgi:uncharacterized protein YxjI
MLNLQAEKQIYIRQRRELVEFFGFESRNKYEVIRSDRSPIAFIAEQSKGLLGLLGRQFFGHWRSFELHVYTPERQQVMIARHPFRWFFQRLEVRDNSGRPMGAVQQRFAIFSKKFDVEAPDGRVIFEMQSPIWKIWTFPFRRNGQQVACLRKKWSGLFAEALMDKDNFEIEFADPGLRNEERLLMLTAAIFVDLQYFEKKARS